MNAFKHMLADIFCASVLMIGWMAAPSAESVFGQTPQSISEDAENWFANDTTQRLSELVSNSGRR